MKKFIANLLCILGLGVHGKTPHFYRIDVIDQCNEKNGYSLCIKSKYDLGEDNVVDYAIKSCILDRWDAKEYTINVEDITNDEYELRFWEKDAVSID